MHFSASLSLFLFLGALSAQAAQNVTVDHTDTTQITYGGGIVVSAPVCIINPDGTIPPGRIGCYNVPSHCTDTAAMGQRAEGFAAWKFKGSALYITSLLSSISPEFSITIDDKAMDVDGARPELKPFECFSLFSTTALDPNVEHTVNMTIKGLSPNRDMSVPGSTVFSLVNYTYTTEDESTATNDDTQADNDTTTSSNNQNSAVLESVTTVSLFAASVVAVTAALVTV